MTKKITIEGMSCGHCVAHVEKALNEVSGVEAVKVELKDKLATVNLSHEVDNNTLIEAVKGAGYEATSIEG